jgi:hypothetical protein
MRTAAVCRITRAIDGLIATKRASGRPKDLLHLPDLELIKDLRERAADQER